jgi:uncharacterized protein YkwD
MTALGAGAVLSVSLPDPASAALDSTPPSESFDNSDYATEWGERYQTFELINAERARRGAAPLIWHRRIAQVAQWKCADMEARAYSSHPMPAGACFEGTCAPGETYIWDWLGVAGVPWGPYGGENLWQAPATGDQMAETALFAFSQSPSHLANMLNPQWRFCGIGMLFSPRVNGVHVVQVFAMGG